MLVPFLLAVLPLPLLAAPAPPTDVNAFLPIEGTWSVLDSHGSVVATATPLYNTVLRITVEDGEGCLEDATQMLESIDATTTPDDISKMARPPKSWYERRCRRQHCILPGFPGKCAMSEGCHVCGHHKICI